MNFVFDNRGRRIVAERIERVTAVHPVSVIHFPALVHVFAGDPGELLHFPRDGATPPFDAPGDPPAADHPMVGDVAMPVPHLPGMDDIEIQHARCTVATENDPFSHSAAKNGAGPSADCEPPGDPITGLLTHVVLHDLRPQVQSGAMVLSGPSGTYTVWQLDGDQVVAHKSQSLPTGEVAHIHAVLQTRTQTGGFGPPLVAAPHFAMPGNQANLYGPALGGMRARSVVRDDGKVDITLQLTPPLPLTGLRVTLGTRPDSGLPNDMEPINWTGAEVTGHWHRRPSGLTILAVTGPGPGDQDGNEASPATVATLSQELDHRPRAIDFTPAARSLLRAHYPSASPPDLAFRLRLVADSPGRVRVRRDQIGARYIRRLGSPDGDALALRGAPEILALPGVPPGLEPHGFSFAVDGTYGSAVLVASADQPLPPDTRTGYRLAGPVWLARRMPLTDFERGQPLVRVGLFCRASTDAEVLIGLHDGDDLRVAAARGPTVSMTVPASPHPAWHRAEVPIELGLAPHPAALWVVAQVTRGVVWWYGALDQAAPLLRTSDAGATWSAATGKPGLQLHIEHLDPATRQPLPDQPLAVFGPGPGGGSSATTQLTPDLAGIDLLGPPGEFRRHWVINRSPNDDGDNDSNGDNNSALASLASLPASTLHLAFSCRRDVELSVRDVVLTYDPWAARGQ